MKHEIFAAGADAQSDGSGRRLYATIVRDDRQRGSVSLLRLFSGSVRPSGGYRRGTLP
jgi:hypothetical protein